MSAPQTQALTASGALDAAGRIGGGTLVVAGGDDVSEWVGDRLEARTLFAASGEPTSVGSVHGVDARAAGGAWVAAQAGLYTLEGEYLSRSPLSTGQGAFTSVTERADGPLAGLWAVTGNGLLRRQGASLEKLTVPGIDAPEAVAVSGDGSGALVLGAGALRRLMLEGGQLLSESPPDGVGAVLAVAAAKKSLYALTDKGVLEYREGASPPWVLCTLGGTPGLSLVADALGERAWVRTADALVNVEAEKLESFPAPALAAGQKPLLAIDALGDVYAASGAALSRFRTGVARTDYGFEADMKPWISQRCVQCHSNFIDVAVFSSRAETALGKVQSGDMPRCEGSTRCANGLPAEDIAVLDGWIRGGKAK